MRYLNPGFVVAALLFASPVMGLPGGAQGVAQTVDQRKAESDRLLQQGNQQYQTSQFASALESWQQALKLYRELKNRSDEGVVLGNIGVAYASLGTYAKAIEFYQQSLAIAREIKDRQEEGRVLESLVVAYRSQEDYPKVIASLEQLLEIAWKLKDRQKEVRILVNLGRAYQTLDNYTKAIEFHEKALAIARELKDREIEAGSLNRLGIAYHSLGNSVKAIECYEKSLEIARESQNRKALGGILVNLGNVYADKGDYDKAIAYYEQSLAIAREIKNRLDESKFLRELGSAYDHIGNYAKAIAYYEQSLAIAREIKNRDEEGTTLSYLGITHRLLGRYVKAIEYHQQHLAITRELKDQKGESRALGNLGNVYADLGNFTGESRVLRQGNVSFNFGNIAKALEYHQQRLVLARQIRDRDGEGVSLGALGGIYQSLGKYDQAIEYQEQRLVIARQLKNRRGEGNALGNLGVSYNSLGNYAKAMEYLEQALEIARAMQDRERERRVLANIGDTLQEQKQSDLSIIFYKQSVNVSEAIRKDNRPLSRDLQASYTQTVAQTYRTLADLLIQQGRIAEAQQVLELLKVQELNDLDPAQRTSPTRLAELALNPLEQEIQTKHNNLIAFGAKVRTCEQNCQPLEAQLDQLRANFKTYTANIEAALKKAKLEGTLVHIDGRNRDFIDSASKIVNAQPGTVLIYPLVLPDKIHLLWASQGGILSSTTCPMRESQLNTTVTAFQTALTDRTDLDGVKKHGKILYDCLIKPLEEKGEWDKNKIQNLVIAADRTINYIPIGALYDGKQFLVERYTISNIINAGLTDVATKLPANPTILGLGISDSLDGLPSLPNVRAELNTIIRSTTSPTGLYLGSLNLNQTATLARFKSQLAQTPYNIVHIATHGQFNPTKPDESFLLLSSGKPSLGDRLTIDRIQQQDDLRKIHLVVLSACQTASGQSSSTPGIEIQGLSAAFVRDRAKAVIASLWSVNDASTTVLMQQFYQNLAQGMTKSEALRQAQLSLLKDKPLSKTKTDRNVVHPLTPNQPTRNDRIAPGYTHPYYWAPFILIGNGL
jgi:CHAT domain-containing protein/tetratricopeptide (TPR) repeat protein